MRGEEIPMTQTPPTNDPLLLEALPELNLNIAQTAELCGISVRQLGYWTRQGYVTAQGKGTRRTYGLESVRHLLAIRKAMTEGASLRQALRSVSHTPASQLHALVSSVSSATPIIAASTRQISLSPIESAALTKSLQSFFIVNRNTRDHAGGLAVKLGRAEEDVRIVAEALCADGQLVPMLCHGLTIFRSAREDAHV